MEESLIVVINARGQLIYKKGDENDKPVQPVRMDIPSNVRYATCVNFGICAMTPPSPYIEETVRGKSMRMALHDLSEIYMDLFQPEIEEKWGEFEYQQTNFWTEKPMKYEKFLRFYGKDNGTEKGFGLTVMDSKRIYEVDDLISRSERVTLSSVINGLQQKFPGRRLEVYDGGCLKLMSDENIHVNTPDGRLISEPNQESRIYPIVNRRVNVHYPFKSTGGRRTRRKRTRRYKS